LFSIDPVARSIRSEGGVSTNRSAILPSVRTDSLRFSGEGDLQVPDLTCVERVICWGLKRLVPSWFVKPTLYLTDMTAIRTEWLKAQGVKGLIFDLDNTLIRGFSGVVEPRIKAKLKEFQDAGIGCLVLSNNIMPRYYRKAEKSLGIPVIGHARKPKVASFAPALERMGLSAGAVAVVGDRILTDVLGGSRIGAKTVLVRSLNYENQGLIRRLLRRIESWFIPRA
jgi:uncharacterized protein